VGTGKDLPERRNERSRIGVLEGRNFVSSQAGRGSERKKKKEKKNS